jgi:hypothetical protein
MRRWNKSNTPTDKKGPKKHTNCNDETKATHQRYERVQEYSLTVTIGPRNHTNFVRRVQGITPTAYKGPRNTPTA